MEGHLVKQVVLEKKRETRSHLIRNHSPKGRAKRKNMDVANDEDSSWRVKSEPVPWILP